MSLFVCNAITLICLSLLILYVIAILIKFLTLKRNEAINFLRNFKKGKFVIVYLAVLPLYVVAYLYAGHKFHIALFSSIAKLMHLVVLRYDYSELMPLIQASPLFNVSLHVGFVLVAINTLLLTFSLVHQYLSNAFHLGLMQITKKPRLYIFGEHKENVDLYFSSKSRYKVIIGDLDEKEREDLYLKKVFYFKERDISRLIENVVKSVNRGEVTVVINEVSAELNLKLCAQFNKAIAELENSSAIMQKLKIFVFGEPTYEEIYFDEIKRSKGCLHYVDPYRQMAIDFLNEYPLTSFLNSDLVDQKTSLIKSGVDLNVILVGFGKVNKQIFLTSVANNQFLTLDENGLTSKAVNYHVFDKFKLEDKNFNHNYYRYKNVKESLVKEQYLPLPPLPSNDIYHEMSVGSPDFYKDLKEVLTKNQKSANVIIISLGNDLENLDIAKKLCSKRDEWQVENCTVFVKNAKEEFGSKVSERQKCFYIGNEKQVYSVDSIRGDVITQMAMLRNQIYALEFMLKESETGALTEEEVKNSKMQANDNWYLSKSPAERESSIYACLSLRSKLNLIGLDYTTKDDPRKGITSQEYFDIYAKDDMPDFETLNLSIEGKKIIKYNSTFKQSTRKNLAVLEHYRWNAFMIMQGFIPATIDQILTQKVEKNGKLKFSNGKSYAFRHHGNLTTMQGLEQFSQLIAERDGLTKEGADVFSYDYQIMDDAFWLVDKMEMKIVKL